MGPFGGVAGGLDQGGQQRVLRGASSDSGRSWSEGSALTRCSFSNRSWSGVDQVLPVDVAGEALAGIAGHQCVDPAAGSRLGDAGQSLPGVLGQVRGEIRHHQEVVGLGDLAGGGVVLVDGFVFVAEIGLDDILHVFGEIVELLLDVAGLGPDLLDHRQFVMVREVHEAREALPQSHGIDHREPRLSGGQRHQQAKHGVLQGGDGIVPPLFPVFDEERGGAGQIEHRGQFDGGRERAVQCFAGRKGAEHRLELDPKDSVGNQAVEPGARCPRCP